MLESRSRDRSTQRLEKSIAMAVDDGDCLRIRHGDMIGLDPHQGAIFLVGIVDGKVASPSSALIQKP